MKFDLIAFNLICGRFSFKKKLCFFIFPHSFLPGYYEDKNDYETDIAITGNFVRVGHALKDTQ